MSRVDELFVEYVGAHRGGGRVDARVFVDQLGGAERAELTALIDGVVARRPRREFDPEASQNSHAQVVAEALHRSLHGRAGLWPAVRAATAQPGAGRARGAGGGLADALGVANRAEKVEHYYRQMERGGLPAAGVSDRVLDALAEVVGTTPQVLREAGRPVVARGPERPSGFGAPAAAAPRAQSSLDTAPRPGTRSTRCSGGLRSRAAREPGRARVSEFRRPSDVTCSGPTAAGRSCFRGAGYPLRSRIGARRAEARSSSRSSRRRREPAHVGDD